MTVKERTELKKFLEYIQDKVEDCYKKETENAIKDYLKEIKIIEVK
jgi:hypothetical protein